MKGEIESIVEEKWEENGGSGDGKLSHTLILQRLGEGAVLNARSIARVEWKHEGEVEEKPSYGNDAQDI